MKKSNANVIFLFLILLILIISFSSATINLGKGNRTLITYGPNSYLSSYLNISFQNQSLDAEFKDNQGNTISLLKILNSSENSNYLFSCDVVDCSENYQSSQKLSSKTYNLAKGDEIIFGLEFSGLLYAINSVSFTIDSDAGESCTSQFKGDVLNDGTYDFSNTKSSNSICLGNYTGCYSQNTVNDMELSITNTPLCQKINLSEGNAYQLGAWVAEKTPGASTIKMSLYNKAGVKINGCDFAKLGMSVSGGEINCSINYLNTKEEEHYICLYADGTGGEYKTKGYSLTKGCGFLGLPPKNGTAAYYLFAKPKKFGAVGSVNVGDNLATNTISNLSVEYISTKYGTNDCTEKCYVPIKIISNVPQNITIRNFSIEYDQQDLPGIEDTKFHELEKTSAKVNSKYQYLILNNLFKLPTKIGNFTYSLSADGKTLISEKMQIKNISISLVPTKVPIAELTTFRLNVVSDSTPIKYYWAFEGGEVKETTTNQVNYIYTEDGNHEIIVGVETKDGGLFSKTFTIMVQSPKETANKTLTELETNIKTINNQIMNLDSFTKEKINEDLNLTYTEAQLKILRSDFNKVKNESDYIPIINALNLINLPETVIQTSTNYISYYPEREDVDLAILSSVSLGDNTYEIAPIEYVDAVLYWNQENLDTKISMKEISYKYGDNLIPFSKTFSLQFNPKGTLENDTYLFIGYLKDLELNTNSSQKEGYTYTKINGKNSISFSTTSDVDFIGLPLFISPAISSLPVLGVTIEEQKTNWGLLIILFLLIIIIGVVAYILLHKWYDKRYEQSLFPNKNNLYNLITYINNQKTQGIAEEKIRDNLRKAKWSSEQIRYVMRKYLGKNTGMWKPATKNGTNISPIQNNKPIQMQGKIKSRSLAIHIILGIITIGIYWGIWLFISSHELRKITKKAPKFILTLSAFIVFILGLAIVGLSNLYSNVDLAMKLSFIMIVFYVIGLIILLISLIKYSKALNEITGFNTTGAFLLLLLVYPIGTIVAQVELNKKQISSKKLINNLNYNPL